MGLSTTVAGEFRLDFLVSHRETKLLSSPLRRRAGVSSTAQKEKALLWVFSFCAVEGT